MPLWTKRYSQKVSTVSQKLALQLIYKSKQYKQIDLALHLIYKTKQYKQIDLAYI